MNFENIVNKLALEKAGERFLNALEDETAEKFLKALLLFMKLKFMFDPSYRKNIENFKGRYQFKSKGDGVAVLVEFDNGKMDIKEKLANDVDITCTFKDGKALINFLLSRYYCYHRKFKGHLGDISRIGDTQNPRFPYKKPASVL